MRESPTNFKDQTNLKNFVENSNANYYSYILIIIIVTEIKVSKIGSTLADIRNPKFIGAHVYI